MKPLFFCLVGAYRGRPKPRLLKLNEEALRHYRPHPNRVDEYWADEQPGIGAASSDRSAGLHSFAPFLVLSVAILVVGSVACWADSVRTGAGDLLLRCSEAILVRGGSEGHRHSSALQATSNW